jgi:hypothetical protein
MAIHSANPTVQRREERILIQARLAQLESKVDRVLVEAGMAKEVGAAAPAFTEADIAEVGKLLVEGRMWLPKYARVTVTTEVEEIKSKVFGTSEVFTHTADQLCCHQLQPMSIQAAIEVGLLVKLGGQWRWSEATYKRLVPPDPRLFP